MWRWWLLIAATVIVTRCTTFFSSLIDDEETFTVFARTLLHGGLPYIDVYDNKPPLIYGWYAAILRLFGETNILAIHIATAIWVMLTCYVLFKIGARVFGEKAGLFAALAYAIFTTTFIPPTIAAHATLLLALPMALSTWFLIKWADDPKAIWMFLSGFCGAAAVLFKYQALMQIIFVLGALAFFFVMRIGPRRRAVIAGVVALLAGALVVALLLFAYLARLGVIRPFYEATWAASFSYMHTGQLIGNYWARLATKGGAYLAGTSLLWIAVAAQAARFIKTERRAFAQSPFQLLMWWWLASQIPAVLAGGRFYGHYFIQLLPCACVIGGSTFAAWWSRGRAARIALAAALSIFAIGWMVPRVFYQTLAERFHLHNLKTEQRIGEYIRNAAPAAARIFVWGEEPSIYFFAERDPASRLLWSDTLVGRQFGIAETQTGAPGSAALANSKDWDILLGDFAKHQPLFIVDCSSGNLRDYGAFPIKNYPLMRDELSRHYNIAATIDGVDIYRLRRD